VLITGGAGFIGSHVAEAVAPSAREVLVLDDLSTGRPELLEPVAGRVDLVRRDVRDPRTAGDVRAFAPDVVFHLAALHYIPECVRDPNRTLAINVDGTRNVVSGLRDAPVESFVLASSASVYGFADHALDETSPIEPIDVYGTSKHLAEDVVAGFHRERPDVACTAARLFNVFGPRETNPHVIPRVVEQARRSPVVRMGHLWPRRDFVFVRDVARALVLAASRRRGLVTCNVGTGVGTSVRELVGAIGRATGTRIRPVTDPDAVRPVDGHLVANASRARGELGWSPQIGLDEGLRELVGMPEAA
jgi:UDP-glucose 4-epimerase